MHFEGRVLAQPVVKHDDSQGIQELPLIFMDALDLAIENRLRVCRLSGRQLKPIRKLALRLPLGRMKGATQTLVAGQRFQFAELTEIGDPTVSYRFRDRPRERRVSQQQPSS